MWRQCFCKPFAPFTLTRIKYNLDITFSPNAFIWLTLKKFSLNSLQNQTISYKQAKNATRKSKWYSSLVLTGFCSKFIHSENTQNVNFKIENLSYDHSSDINVLINVKNVDQIKCDQLRKRKFSSILSLKVNCLSLQINQTHSSF